MKKYKSKALKDNPYICFLFMDDDESHWTASEINEIWFDQIKEAIYYINLNASYYKVNLNIGKGLYSSCEENCNVCYKGNINTNLFSGIVEGDILDQAAISLNFESKKSIDDYLKTHSKSENIVYVIMLNKKGISYADEKEGYCVVFNGYLNTNKNCCSAVIVHELFHLFGAMDYYDPYKKYPKRKVLAETYFPNDIMLKIYRNVYDNNIGKYTAYSLGWISDCPKECDCVDWWR